ncbi:DUF3558 domain-containing protein [Streptomyces sp. NPDC097619]|uniref:DUF3558 domain-containing protein n=1 Tax=Streptomyces sp. NPDC097619 TaxID=3157228 RepID=UPI003325AA1C
MQRKAVLPGIAAVLAVLVTGCSGGTGSEGPSADSKAGETAVAAPPGKYSSLPEPCRTPSDARLEELLPAAPSLTTEQREQLYAGKADPTYDADRRVACRWRAEDTDATRLLSIGFERVISYDRAVSDDDRAQEVYDRALAAAHIPEAPAGSGSPGSPSGSPSATGSPSGSPAAGTVPQGTAGTGDAAADTPTGSPETSASGSATPVPGSRVLEGPGDAAFLEDRLGAAGPTAQTRTVRIVFRTSNVIVTVEYTVQPGQSGITPDSEEIQDGARKLAGALAERFAG